MRSFAFVVSLALAAAVGTVVACSSSGSASCPTAGKCTGEDFSAAECSAAVSKCGVAAAEYFGCYVAHEVCTASGAIDEDATETAAENYCTIPAGLITCAESLSNLDGGSTTTVTNTECGFSGEACCTEGGTACNDGCCDPSTKLCVNIDEPCSGGKTSCLQSETSAPSICTACGEPGEPCCTGDSCGTGCCDFEANPAVCVAPDGMCAPEGSTSEVCPAAGGSCTFCGTEDSPCCPGSSCSSSEGFTLLCDDTNTCVACGSEDDVCCPGEACSESTTVCSAGTCTFCGVTGQPCCADDVCEGSTCTAGTCM